MALPCNTVISDIPLLLCKTDKRIPSLARKRVFIEKHSPLANIMHIILARDCRKVARQHLGKTGELTVELVPLQQAVDMVMTNVICCNSSAHGILRAARLKGLWQHRTIASADLSGSFAPVPQFQKREIHTVFPHFRNFEPAQNLSLSFLAELCGVAL